MARAKRLSAQTTINPPGAPASTSRKDLLTSTAEVATAPAQSADPSAEKSYDSEGRTPKEFRDGKLNSTGAGANAPAAQVRLPYKTGPPEQQLTLSADLLVGAGAIAKFLFGTNRRRRAVYHLFEQNALPGFKWGGQLCARRSTLLEFIRSRESDALTSLAAEPAE
jgi:hypothetical protein